MKDLTKTCLIVLLVILGLLITIDLAFIYYQANFNQYALPSFCSVNELIDCDGIAKTTKSQFMGVPLAYWGIFLYSFILFLLGVDKIREITRLKVLEVFKNKFHYIASLGIISFSISMILMCISLFIIKKICIMCFITYVINLVIGLIAVSGLEDGFIGAIKQSWNDFMDALQTKSYKIAFIIVVGLSLIFLNWTYTSAKFAPSLKWDREYGTFVRTKADKHAIKGNILGSTDEKAVVLHIYSDYMCPMCFACNNMLHKIARDFKNVRIQHHALPLDTDCNKYLKEEFHKGSCILAKYAEAAYKQDKFWAVNDLLFDKKPRSEEEIIEILENSKLELDMEQLKKDAHNPKINALIQNDIDYSVSKKIIGTPAMEMGKDFEMGVKGYKDLKKWVTKHGGKKRLLTR